MHTGFFDKNFKPIPFGATVCIKPPKSEHTPPFVTKVERIDPRVIGFKCRLETPSSTSWFVFTENDNIVRPEITLISDEDDPEDSCKSPTVFSERVMAYDTAKKTLICQPLSASSMRELREIRERFITEELDIESGNIVWCILPVKDFTLPESLEVLRAHLYEWGCDDVVF